MTQGPTTINGPLNTPEADVDARRVVAYFTTQQEAKAAKSALIGAGIAGTQISIMEARGNRLDLQPADKSIIGHIREALLPDDGQVGEAGRHRRKQRHANGVAAGWGGRPDR
jgi:hypothetical protein